MAPASNSSASLSEVLPLPRCPTRATLRISSGDLRAICLLSSGTAEPNARRKQAPIFRGMPEEDRGRRRISRRTLRSPSSVEAYLQAGVIPRFIERARQIEDETERQLLRLERAYEWMRGKYAGDPETFADHWTAMADRWSFADVNDLIDEHN